MGNETNALQANFKTPNGSLFNVYGKTPDEFWTNVQAFAGMAQELIAMEAALLGKTAPVQAAPAIPEAVTQAFPGAQVVSTTPIAQAAPAANPGSPTCKHGPMNYKEGEKNGKTWKAWMCGGGRDVSDKCAPQWVK